MAKIILFKHSFISFFTILCFLVLFSSLSGSVANQESNDSTKKATMPKKHIAILEEYCYDCHDSVTKKGKVDLENLSFNITKDTKTAETWQHILDAMNSDEMPPPGKRQVDNSLKSDFLKDLSTQMVKARDILSDNGGKITMRRLNLREYKNSMTALLGVLPATSALPTDTENVSKFDTIGNELFFSSHQLEQYLKIATAALDKAFDPYDLSELEPIKIRFDPEITGTKAFQKYHEMTLENKKKLDEYCKEQGIRLAQLWQHSAGKSKAVKNLVKYNTKIRTDYPFVSNVINLPEHQLASGLPLRHGKIQGLPLVSHSMTIGGRKEFTKHFGSKFMKKHQRSKKLKFILRVRGGYYNYAPERRRYIEYGVGVTKSRRRFGVVKLNGTVENPGIVEIPITILPADTVAIGMRKYRYSPIGSKHDRPYVWIDYIELEGPFIKKSPKIYKGVPERNSGESEKDYVRRVIEDFATTAFRYKKPAPEYIDKLVDYYFAYRVNNNTDSPSSFIKTFASVLTSPAFLFIKENQINGKKTKISDKELATRLSYFLTSSPPSAGLLKLADQGQLSNPETLKRIVQLYLKNKKSDSFVQSFLHQWLHMSRLDQFDFSPLEYPEMDKYLRKSMRREIYNTFRYVLKNQLPISTLLKSDFVIIDNLLADLYDIKGVSGPEFRKVKLPKDSPRGGLLGTGAFHVMGSDGTHTSPVERGAWVLRYLLNDPPPPAPANVPDISRLDKKIVSTREKTKIHQELPQCASCHQKIDPIGFGLENFTATGKWREIEKVVKKVHRKSSTIGADDIRRPKKDYVEFPINTTGKLASGKSFKNYYELRDAIFEHKDDFTRGFTQHLIAYALGRPYSISDYNFVTEILQKTAKEKHTISSIIETVVLSEQFRTK